MLRDDVKAHTNKQEGGYNPLAQNGFKPTCSGPKIKTFCSLKLGSKQHKMMAKQLCAKSLKEVRLIPLKHST